MYRYVSDEFKSKPHIKLLYRGEITGKMVWVCKQLIGGWIYTYVDESPSKALEGYLRSREANK